MSIESVDDDFENDVIVNKYKPGIISDDESDVDEGTEQPIVYKEEKLTKNSDLFDDEESDSEIQHNRQSSPDLSADEQKEHTSPVVKPRKPNPYRAERAAAANVEKVLSDIQRAEREARVSLPKFLPEKMTLKEFMAKKKGLNLESSTITQMQKESEKGKSPKASYLSRIDPKILNTKPRLDGAKFMQLDLCDKSPKTADNWILNRLEKHVVRKNSKKTSIKPEIIGIGTSSDVRKLTNLKDELWNKMRKQREEQLAMRYEFHRRENKNEEEELSEEEEEDEILSEEGEHTENEDGHIESNDELGVNDKLCNQAELDTEKTQNMDASDETQNIVREESIDNLHLVLEGVPDTLPISMDDMSFIDNSQFPDSQESVTISQRIRDIESSEAQSQIEDVANGFGMSNGEMCEESNKDVQWSDTQLLNLCSGQFVPQSQKPADAQESADSVTNIEERPSSANERDINSDDEDWDVDQSSKRKPTVIESDVEENEDKEHEENDVKGEENDDSGDENEGDDEQENDDGDLEEEEDQDEEEDEELLVIRQLEEAQKKGIKFSTFKQKNGAMRKDFLEKEAELSGDEVDSDENEEIGSDEDVMLPEAGDLDIVPSESELKDQIGKVFLKQALDDDKRRILAYQSALIDDNQTTSDVQLRRFHWRQKEDETEQAIVNEENVDIDTQNVDALVDEKNERTIWLTKQASKIEEEDEDHLGDESEISELGRIALQRDVSVTRQMTLKHDNDPPQTRARVLDALCLPRRHSLLSLSQGDNHTSDMTMFKSVAPVTDNPSKSTFKHISPKKDKAVKRPSQNAIATNAKILKQNSGVSVFDMLNK